MAKSIFRYLRGEINGYYLNNIHNTVEKEVTDIKDFFTDFYNQQFQLDKISSKTLFNIGKFASIFLPRRPLSESITSIYMSESKVVDDTEFSERGLYNIENEKFNFYHLNLNSYSDNFSVLSEYEDINTLATEKERSSLIGDEEVLGYISENAEDVLDESGNVRISKVSTTTPTSGAYSDYYGNTFLYLSEGETSYVAINSHLYIELYKAIQFIRYNGVSIKSLCSIISVLCPSGLVKIDHIDISLNGKYIYVYYNYNNNVDVTYKEQRLSLLEYLINLKYKQIVLVENSTQE